MSLTFTVVGTPAPQGSFRPMVNKHTGKPVLVAGTQSGYLRYRADIRATVTSEMAQRGYTLLSGGIGAYIVFRFPRPESHWLPANSKRPAPVLRADAPGHVVGSPDIDKVCRAVLDALTGILYRDDAQVVALSAVKTYADGYGAPGTTSVAITHEPLLEGDSDGITH